MSWKYFPADNSGGFELVDNPLKAGINITEKVGKAIEKAFGEQVWQGKDMGFIKFGSRVDVFLPLDAEILVTIDEVSKGNQTISVQDVSLKSGTYLVTILLNSEKLTRKIIKL